MMTRAVTAEEKTVDLLAEAHKDLRQALSIMQRMDLTSLGEGVRRCLHQSIAMVHGAMDQLDLLQGPARLAESGRGRRKSVARRLHIMAIMAADDPPPAKQSRLL